MWRTGTVLAVLLGVWAMLAATRITRGEEDAGRWDLLLAGRLPLAAAVARHLGVLIAARWSSGSRSPAGADRCRHRGRRARCCTAPAWPLVGVFFVGGRRASPRRCSRPGRAASGAAAACSVVGLLARMVGDGVAALALAAVAVPVRADRARPARTTPTGCCRCSVLAVAAVALLAAAAAWPRPA